MRKLTVLEHISLDGVIQAPSGKDEDPSGGFAYGGWASGESDPVLDALVKRQLDQPIDLLLGRKTFEIWAPYWPEHGDIWPRVNPATKYVASRTLTSHTWQNSVFLNGNVAEEIAQIKQLRGPDLHVWGSSILLQTLLRHDLVDEFWLMIFPVTVGSGKRLFAEGTIPAAFKLTEGQITPTGVIVVTYARAGALITGNL